jgi:hypothetical protein
MFLYSPLASSTFQYLPPGLIHVSIFTPLPLLVFSPGLIHVSVFAPWPHPRFSIYPLVSSTFQYSPWSNLRFHIRPPVCVSYQHPISYMLPYLLLASSSTTSPASLVLYLHPASIHAAISALGLILNTLTGLPRSISAPCFHSRCHICPWPHPSTSSPASLVSISASCFHTCSGGQIYSYSVTELRN